MSRWVFLCATVCLAAPALAQYESADYKLERWDEDYSYLGRVKSENDFFDPIKYIPLEHDEWYLSFGGQERYRFDYFNNSAFGSGTQDETGFHLIRSLVHVDAHFGPRFRAFVQFDSSLSYDRAGGSRPGDVDNADFQQAFLDFKLPVGNDNSATVRVGRQELVYGAQRLISPSDWSNVRRSFDGVRASVELPNDTLDLFAVRPVNVVANRLDGDDDHTYFSGVYNVTALPTLIPGAHSKLDLYLLALDRQSSAINVVSSDTFTVGTRFHSEPRPWDVDVELDGQFGRNGDSVIAAYSVAADAGYSFSDMTFAPRASVAFDLASGSPNPAHRFNQLFPPVYTLLGHLYLFGRQNLIDLHPGATLNLSHDLTLTLAQHLFWRQNVNDAVYNLESQVVRVSSGSHRAYIGTEFDVSMCWQVERHVSIYTGWAHFFTGSFINSTGTHADQDFFYTMATLTY
jgi:hypothetical protein